MKKLYTYCYNLLSCPLSSLTNFYNYIGNYTSFLSLYQAIRQSKSQEALYIINLDTHYNFEALDVCCAIKHADPHADFICLSQHQDLLDLTIKYHLKPYDLIYHTDDTHTYTALCKSLSDYQSDYDYKILNTFFKWNINHRLITLPIEHILYFEKTGDHHISLYTQQKTYHFSGSLRKIEILYPCFQRIHRSILINPLHLLHYDTVNHQIHLAFVQTHLDVGSTYQSQFIAIQKQTE